MTESRAPRSSALRLCRPSDPPAPRPSAAVAPRAPSLPSRLHGAVSEREREKPRLRISTVPTGLSRLPCGAPRLFMPGGADYGYFCPTPRNGIKSTFGGWRVQKAYFYTLAGVIPSSQIKTGRRCENFCQNLRAETCDMRRVFARNQQPISNQAVSRGWAKNSQPPPSPSKGA